MSHVDYDDKVKLTQNKLVKLLKSDAKINPEILSEQDKSKFPNFIDTREKSVNHIGTRYIEYIQMYKVLNEACDQIVQPQKNQILRKLLNCVIGRLLELKNEMVAIDGSDYHFFDSILPDAKLTPYDLKIDTPNLQHDKYEMAGSIQNKIRSRIGTNSELTENYDNRYYKKTLIPIEKPTLKYEDALKIIQNHERARQSNLRFNLMKELKKTQAFNDFRQNNQKTLNISKLTNEAAIKFQKIWRGRQIYKQAKLDRDSELGFINCVLSPDQNQNWQDMQEKMNKISKNRKLMRLENEKEMVDALTTFDTELKVNEEDAMKTLMADTIREWYLNEYEEVGKLPEIPETGTNFLFDPKLAREQEEAALKEAAQEKEIPVEDEDERYKLQTSNFLDNITNFNNEYNNFDKKVRKNQKIERNFQEHNVMYRKVEYEKELEKKARQEKLSKMLEEGEDLEPNDPDVIDSNLTVIGHNNHAEIKDNVVFFKRFNDHEETAVKLNFDSCDSTATTPRASVNQIKETGSEEQVVSKTQMMKKAVKEENAIKWHPANNLKKTLNGQKFEKSIIRNSLRDNLEVKVREEVEKMMAIELQHLSSILDSKSKKSKKAKKPKGKKGKKEKDPTANRTMESLEDELIEQGILTIPPKQKFDEIIGNYQLQSDSFEMFTAKMAGTPQEELPKESLLPCCVNDLKNLLNLYGTLPLCDKEIISELKNRIRSILLVGPAGCGKKSLAYCIAHESQSVFFDLSNDNLVGKYMGKGGTAMLLHMVFKVAKHHQPAVIFINNADTMFYKKVPKEMQQFEPKRLKKDWPKIIKKFPNAEKILVVGTSEDPMPADVKGLSKIWDKILLVPMPDYGARILLWENIFKIYLSGIEDPINTKLENKHADIASLARMTKNYTTGQICLIAKETLASYQGVLNVRKLKVEDFIANLSRVSPIEDEVLEGYQNWYCKTPLGKNFLNFRKKEEE